jgi:hypothetical protein
METILALNPPLEEVVACIHCRMYLRAIFLSDIVTSDGIFISDGSWNGDPYIPPYKLQSWPHYNKPPRRLWGMDLDSLFRQRQKAEGPFKSMVQHGQHVAMVYLF